MLEDPQAVDVVDAVDVVRSGLSGGAEHLRLDEILDADSRPTLVLDLDPDHDPVPAADNSLNKTGKALVPVFCNAALRLHERLHDALIGVAAEGLKPNADANADATDSTFQDFKRWAIGKTKHDDSNDIFPLTFLYGDMLWTGSTVKKRWRLISGNHSWRAVAPLADLSSGAPPDIATGGLRAERNHKKNEQAPTKIYSSAKTDGTSGSTGLSSASIPLPPAPQEACIDWTSETPKGVLSSHIQCARSVDWATTPLGPMEKWSPEFRQTANLLMGNPHPAALFWGSELTMLYNEAYAAEVAGNKHPSLMGTGFSGPFAELWEYARPVFAECARTGISVRMEDDYLPINRHGLLEETFFSWSFTPLYGGTRRILGFYNAPFETTKQVLAHRRMRTITRVGECTAQARAVKEFWGRVLQGLQDNERDVPFALLYSVGDGDDGEHSSASSGSTISLKTCHLEGSIGVPDGHLAAPSELDLKRSREGFIPSFREAMRTREPTLLHTRDGTLPEALLDGIQWRGFGDPCREAIIFPVRPTNGDAVLAFLVIGVNPRRPYDDEYKAFTSMLNRQLATSLASAILFDEETRRSRDMEEAAALERQELTAQLNLQASRLRRMTELSPLGMFFISPDGVLLEANERFYEMTGHRRDGGERAMSWTDCLTPDSAALAIQGWQQLIEKHQPWSCELRLRQGQPASAAVISSSAAGFQDEPMDNWVLFTANPELVPDKEGSLRAVMGSITDISHLKWAQGLQNRRLQEAERMRRQQNEFIDITSHEMRNPLSAVLQCADHIVSALAPHGVSAGGHGAHPQPLPSPTPQTVLSCIEAAQTILLCVQHQKSIVDDILTISKMDSNLLVMDPVASRPVDILQRTVRMFDSELQVKGIVAEIEVRPRFLQLGLDWVSVDSTRVSQILINLLTNAIKFTASAVERRLVVALDASLAPPEGDTETGFEYVPSSLPLVVNKEEEEAAVVYLHFSVQDTGCGLTAQEKQTLFRRFQQASPRTHAQYGGSGLGLFISKRLAELHGGRIGVASEAGKGSTFGFFVQGRKCSGPAPGAGPPLLAEPRVAHNPDSLPQQNPSPSSSPMHPKADPSLDANSIDIPPSLGLEVEVNVEMAPPHSQSDMSATRRLLPQDTSILVVEDNLINQRVLVTQLTKQGCRVAVASDGVKALASLEAATQPFTVVLMDLEMPNMDGLTCTREIRMREEWGGQGRVPIIAVTANVRDEQIAAALQSGMDDVVSKPFGVRELWAKIEQLVVRPPTAG